MFSVEITLLITNNSFLITFHDIFSKLESKAFMYEAFLLKQTFFDWLIYKIPLQKELLPETTKVL